MAMNTRDERLYHYEYRRPRLSNPTYNSNNLFDSLNMFVRDSIYNPTTRTNPRYSLPKTDRIMENYSQVIDYRTTKRNNDFSTILPPLDRQRETPYNPERERMVIGVGQARGGMGGKENQYENLRASRGSETMQNRSHLSYRLGEPVSKGFEQYQHPKK